MDEKNDLPLHVCNKPLFLKIIIIKRIEGLVICQYKIIFVIVLIIVLNKAVIFIKKHIVTIQRR